MMFCEKCGSLLVPKKDGKKLNIKCKCGYKPKKKEGLVIKEEVKLTKIDEINVIDKKVEVLPKTREECQKCHNKEAYYWLVQTRAADEAATRFFKCVKCNYTWRSYT